MKSSVKFAAIVLTVYLAMLDVKVLAANARLQVQAHDLEGQTRELQRASDTLREQIGYYQTSSYREKAGHQLGYQQSGEHAIALTGPK
jgi:cell division protein FtsB